MHILAYCYHLLVLPQFEFLHEKGFCILLLESVIQHNWCLCYNGLLALGAHCSRDVAIPSLRFLAVHEREDVCSAFFMHVLQFSDEMSFPLAQTVVNMKCNFACMYM